MLTPNNPTLYNTLWQFAHWKNRKILLVGYSEINRGLISYLEHKGVNNLTLCTRDPTKVHVEQVHVVGRDVLRNWQHYDVIVCASKSDDYLISGNGNEDHVIFDLSVPRGVDPQTGARVYNIEELNQRIEQKRSMVHLEASEDFIWENVVRLTQIYRMKARIGLQQVGC